MKKILILLLFVYFAIFGQEEIEKMPSIKGGIMELATNIKYPQTAKEEGIEGTVMVEAMIDENGKVISTKIVKSVSKDLDQAAITALEKTEFIPAENKGKKVKAEVTIPIKFKLDDCKKN